MVRLGNSLKWTIIKQLSVFRVRIHHEDLDPGFFDEWGCGFYSGSRPKMNKFFQM
jgi:hypothetical protein